MRCVPLFLLSCCLALTSLPIAAAETRYVVVIQGHDSGAITARDAGAGKQTVDFHYKTNGRGPTLAETFTMGPDGGMLNYRVTGKSTFGGMIDETFEIRRGKANWRSSGDRGSAAVSGPVLYVPGAESSPLQFAALARALLMQESRRLPVLPGGELSIRELTRRKLQGAHGEREVMLVAVFGEGLAPDLMWLDAQSLSLFAMLEGDAFLIAEDGWREPAQSLADETTRQGEILLRDFSKQHAHAFSGPLLIRNARVFDSEHAVLGAAADIYIHEGRIAAIYPADSAAQHAGAVVDAGGRTLLPGLFDMHAHFSDWQGPQHLAAGVTSIRDMGNSNAQLAKDRANIERGDAMGPNVFPAGFIEGTGENAAHSDFMVATEAEAFAAVDWYAQRGYRQIKLYNSFPKAILPATAAYAHSRGLRVSGHVPVFLRAEEAVRAGYDELTHINQLMLNFLIGPEDDTRTLLRFTRILEHGADVDLDSKAVQDFIALLQQRHIVVDPTLATFEDFYQRPGDVHPGFVKVIDHLPVSTQRGYRTNTFDITAKSYARNKAGYDKMRDLVGRLHRAGITLVSGTDGQPGLMLHRELELYVDAGIPAAEALRIATWNGAKVSGSLDRLGSISVGKQADLVLVDGDPTQDISLVRKPLLVLRNGVAYYPDEIDAALGIKPFATSLKFEQAATVAQ